MSAGPHDHAAFMRRAIALSRANPPGGADGPFGAVVVRDGEILGEGHNAVHAGSDPTAHAEIVALRRAAARLGRAELEGAVLYTSCEPCPMCLGAAWWARIARIYYGNGRADAAAIGFDDDLLYVEVAKPIPARSLPLERLLPAEARAVFEAWPAKRG